MILSFDIGKVKKYMIGAAVTLSAVVAVTVQMQKPVMATPQIYNLEISIPDSYATSAGDKATEYIYLDGVPYKTSDISGSVTGSAGNYKYEISSISLDDTDGPKTATFYNYYTSNGKYVPDKMIVYDLNYDNGTSKVTGAKIDAFDDMIKYLGFSVKFSTFSGLRVKSGILKTTKDALIAGTNGYELIEYGQLAMSGANYNAGIKCVYPAGGATVPKPARCYYTSDGTTHDNNYGESNGYTVFCNPLEFSSNSSAKYGDDYYFRAYVKVKNTSTNEEQYIYGPITGRSMYTTATNVLSKTSGTDRNSLYKIINTVDYKDSMALFLGESIMEGCDGATAPANGTPADASGLVSAEYRPYNYIINEMKKRYNNITISSQTIIKGGATYSRPGANTPDNMPNFADRFEAQITGADRNKVKLIVIMCGTNDWWFTDQGQNSIPNQTAVFGELNADGSVKTNAGGTYDESYSYNVYYTLNKLATTFPNAQVVMITPPRAIVNDQVASTYPNGQTGKTMADYIARQKAIAEYLQSQGKNITVVDSYDQWISDGNRPYFYSLIPDGIHLNLNGYKTFDAFLWKKIVEDILEK